MKRFLTISLLFAVSYLSAQQKYQNLLWKISGNNLTKDSYLYGTMHVSGKVAFRLDDVFYKALYDCDAVALESDPTTWMEHSYEMMNTMPNYGYNSGYGNSDFYAQRFSLNFPNDLITRSAIRFDNYIINGYLYRKSFAGDNFEEETYLDMFIFQAGKKQNKPVIGLEDFKESRYLTTKASYNMTKRKVDAWLLKRYKEQSRFDFTEEAYRNRNLDLLDSIGNATNTVHFRKYMLYERNENMVDVLDTLMHSTSIFAGVGAAHLPGSQGMIEMLRRRGYTVTPLKSNQTAFGKNSKKELESIFVKPVLEEHATDDGFLSIKSFEKLRELSFLNQKYYVATDMTNGAYLAITRINTFEYLNNKHKTKLQDIDHMLFEDIPGEIIEKTYFDNPYKGINVVNKTKKGDYQRYAIYKTPLEIIIVKLGGKKDYVLKYGNEVFESISFRQSKEEWHRFVPVFKKYEFTIPANYITENFGKAGKRIVQANDAKGFYFFQEVPIDDINYIEEDTFEAKYIHKAFLDTYDIKLKDGKFEKGSYVSYVSTTQLDTVSKKEVSLKTIVKDASYYLLGYVGQDQNNANKFFNSFKFRSTSYIEKTDKVIDTSLHFTVNTMVKPPFPNMYMGYVDNKRKPYEQFVKNARYTSKTNEVIHVTRTKYHDLHMFANIDSLWQNIKKPLLKDYSIANEKKSMHDNMYTYSYVLRDSLSKKQIRVKNILKKGTLFELKTLQDSLGENSKFVNDFYKSFVPKDTLLGRTLFVDKVPEFLEYVKKDDSITLHSSYLLKFSKSHTEQLKAILNDFKFPKDKQALKNLLVRKLIAIEDETIIPFIKNLYTRSYSEPQIQFTIINSLIEKKTKSSYDLILELLAIDFPVSNDYNMSSLFSSGSFKKDSLKLKRKLFPELLKYSTINEYKTPIYKLLATLAMKGLIKPKDYKRYKDQILNDAKLELKRSLYTKNSKRYTGRTNYGLAKRSLLEDQVKLLFPFKDEKELRIFFLRLLESNDEDALSTYYALLRKHKLSVNQKLADKLVKKDENFSVLVDKLETLKLEHDLLHDDLSKQRYAQSKIQENRIYANAADEISFLKKESIKVKNDSVAVYFFKVKNKNQYAANNSFMHAIAFKIKKGKLVLKPIFESERNGRLLDNVSADEEVVEEILEKIRYKDRRRLSSSGYVHY